MSAAWILGVHLFSVHIPASQDMQNFNPGVYVRHEGITAGVYSNSLRRTSVYLGYTLEAGPAALTLGAITGYDRQPRPCGPEDSARGWSSCWYGDRKLTPLIAPSVRLPALGGFTPRISYIPRFGAASRFNVFHLSIEKELP